MRFFEFLKEYGAVYSIRKHWDVGDCLIIRIDTLDDIHFESSILSRYIDVNMAALYDTIFTDKDAEACIVQRAIEAINDERNARELRKGVINMKNIANYVNYSDLFNERRHNSNDIKKVIFNYPATIVIWEDGTKTVAKCHGDDIYDKTTGLLICVAKRYLGGTSKLTKLIDKWVSEEEDYICDTPYSELTPYDFCGRCEKHFRPEDIKYPAPLYKGPICEKCKTDLDANTLLLKEIATKAVDDMEDK